MSDSMFSAAFNVLIKILESYRPQIPTAYTLESMDSCLEGGSGGLEGLRRWLKRAATMAQKDGRSYL